jgi:hypothetical protein
MGDCRFCPPAPAHSGGQQEVFRLCGLLQDQPGMRDEKHITLLPGLCLTVISGLSCFSQGDQTKVNALLDHIEQVRAALTE